MEESPEWMTKTDFPFHHRRGIQAMNEDSIDQHTAHCSVFIESPTVIAWGNSH